MAVDPLAKAASALIAPQLKDEGFRKQALTWNRSRSGLTAVVNIQRSQWSTRDDCGFTVNIGVGFGSEHEGRFLRPDECLFPMQARLGEVIPGHDDDKWWSINPNTERNAEIVVTECAAELFEHGSRWLEARRTPARLIEALRFDQAGLIARGASPDWEPHIDRLIERLAKMKAESR